MKLVWVAVVIAVYLVLPGLGVANTLTFGISSQRTGWDPRETALTPLNVAGVLHRWDSAPFAAVTINGRRYPPHVYGTPLEVDAIPVGAGIYQGKTLSLILVATTNGDAYAVNAFARIGVPAGAIVWQTHLGTPGIEKFDGGMPLGVASTGIVDIARARWYVTDHIHNLGWTAFALDLHTGKVIAGWPILLSANIPRFNTNGNLGWGDGIRHLQRGALNLSLDGATLYVPMGTYNDDTTGWLVAIDTARAIIASSFSTSNTSAIPGAGIWSSGGVAVGLNGRLYATTGNAATPEVRNAGVWGESLLVFTQNTALSLQASYTPWNLNSLEAMDADIGSGSVLLPPDLGAGSTTTPHVGVFGSKQGVVYLLDLDHLPGGRVFRQPAATAAQDGSLQPPSTKAPLAVFGPYCNGCENNGDYAKMRSTPAYYTLNGQSYVFVTGTPKAAVNSPVTVAPCLVRLRIVTLKARPAYLAIDAASMAVACLSPGSPLLVGQKSPLVWVLDANVRRRTSMVAGPPPVLRAFDARTMQQLWTSGATLHSGGKYTLPTVSHGTVFVGTDRIQAFSL